MKDNSKHNFILFLICGTIFISIVLILKNNQRDTFYSYSSPKYAYQAVDVNRFAADYLNKNPYKIKLSKNDYNQVMDYYFNRRSGMSWEGNATLRNPRAKAIAELVYRRDCPVPLISKMGKYNLYQEDIPVAFKPRSIPSDSNEM